MRRVRRVVVLGTSGAGKSTLSAGLAERLGAKHIERDRLFGAAVPMDSPAYRETVAAAVSSDAWVFDGMPYYVEDVVFAVADTVVCLDFSRLVVMQRVLRRTLRQTLLRRAVGAHEPLRVRDLRSPEHPVRWAWSTFAERREQMREWPTREALAAVEVVGLRSPSAARRWLDQRDTLESLLDT